MLSEGREYLKNYDKQRNISKKLGLTSESATAHWFNGYLACIVQLQSTDRTDQQRSPNKTPDCASRFPSIQLPEWTSRPHNWATADDTKIRNPHFEVHPHQPGIERQTIRLG